MLKRSLYSAALAAIVLASPALLPQEASAQVVVRPVGPSWNRGVVVYRPNNPGWNNPGWNNPGWNNPGWNNPGWNNNRGWYNPGWNNNRGRGVGVGVYRRGWNGNRTVVGGVRF